MLLAVLAGWAGLVMVGGVGAAVVSLRRCVVGGVVGGGGVWWWVGAAGAVGRRPMGWCSRRGCRGR